VTHRPSAGVTWNMVKTDDEIETVIGHSGLIRQSIGDRRRACHVIKHTRRRQLVSGFPESSIARKSGHCSHSAARSLIALLTGLWRVFCVLWRGGKPDRGSGSQPTAIRLSFDVRSTRVLLLRAGGGRRLVWFGSLPVTTHIANGSPDAIAGASRPAPSIWRWSTSTR